MRYESKQINRMKYLLLLPILLVSNCLPAQMLWSNTYQISENFSNDQRGLVILDNGEIVVGGFYNTGTSSATRTSFLLSAELATGDSIDFANCTSISLCDERNDILVMARNQENDIFTAGTQIFGASDYLARINGPNDLSVNWIINNFSPENVHSIFYIESVSDGMIIIGRFSNVDYFVIKFNDAGEQMWSTRLSPSSPSNVLKVATLPNDNIAIYYQSGNFPNNLNFLALLDAAGNIQYNLLTEKTIFALGATNDNKIIALQKDDIFSDGPYELVTYDENTATTVLSDSCNVNFPREIFINQNDEIFIVDDVDITDDDQLKILKLSSTGDSLWSETYGETGFDYTYYESEFVDDQTIVFMGASRNNITSQNPKILLMAVDVSNLPTSNNNFTTNEDRFLIYPNPGRNEIKIVTNNPEIGQGFYRIYNLDGRLVQEAPFYSQETIDIRHLVYGVYSIELFNQSKEKIGVEKLISVN